MGKNFIGIDIGTNSVGIAQTDENYRVQKFKGNAMWASAVFDSANQSADCRGFRVARRRLDRRQQRRDLLIELMAPAIVDKDPDFFKRIRESALWSDDKTTGSRYTYFSDDDYTDKQFHRDYPTIHHLISKLMNDPSPHDPRLVFIACSYILTHRGHFLNEADKDKISDVLDIGKVFKEFADWFRDNDIVFPFGDSAEKFGKILTDEKSIRNRPAVFYSVYFGGKKPKPAIDDAIDVNELVKLVSGGVIEISKLFMNEEYQDLENNKIRLSDASFDEKEPELRESLGDDFGLIAAAKNIYDWSLLTGVLAGSGSLSEAKVRVYEKHGSDLAALRRVVRHYCPEQYKNIFKTCEKGNYTSYSGNLKSVKNTADMKRCDQEEFCDYLRSKLKNVKPESGDTECERVLREIAEHTLCPRQVNSDNRVIPYQLYYTELKKILENAANYIPQLNAADEYGSTASKILRLMTFRVPYYVGPLVKKNENDNAWIVRKGEGRILPWNFDDLVDRDRCEDEFIKRMTCKCTYVAGEDVLPKNSLLYSKFMVLNEINNIGIDGKRENFPVEAKQKIYTELFEKRKRVSVRDIKNLLVSEGYMKPESRLEGLDITVKSSLKSWNGFKKLLASGMLSEADTEEIIERMACTTDTARFRAWLEKFGLTATDIKYISGLKYADFGRLSRAFLTEIPDIDPATGEELHPNIITMMWETNKNLMELLSQNYNYSSLIESMNREYYSQHPLKLDERLREMYIPSAVRRPIKRAVEMVREYSRAVRKAPDRIFVEMARDLTDPQKKGKRTQSRRDLILEYYKNLNEDTTELRALLESKSDDELRSEKLYLYFIQLGRCMYSGQSIDIEQLSGETYNVDHIFPRCMVKDDSIENKVLVLSTLNAAKGDDYPIDSDIQCDRYGLWKKLRDIGLMGKTKYDRLTRSTPFSDDELAGFISRQMVETRQSTKAVAALLKEEFPESEIVYVKAGLASEFRNQYNLLKCRELNDLHHAKDAYLNIVMGNIYHVKFTSDPLNFVKEYRGKKEVFNLKIETLLSHDVIRNGETAWVGDGSWLDAVKKQMSKNNIRYVRYSFRRKGGFFDQQPLKKEHGQTPRKKSLPIERYGGYNNTTASFFSLVRYRSEKTSGVVIIPVELMYSQRFERDAAFAEEYALNTLGNIVSLKSGDSIRSVDFPLGGRILKVNTLLDIDGFRCTISSKDSGGKRVNVSSAAPLIVGPKETTYIKRLHTINGRIAEGEKNKREYKVRTEYDMISREKNLEIYDLLCKKVQLLPFSVFFSNAGDLFAASKDKFEDLSVSDQVKALVNMISIFKTGRSSGCDLLLLGGAKNSSVLRINSTLTNLKGYKSIRIIDQSPAGLYEKASPNLLTL